MNHGKGKKGGRGAGLRGGRGNAGLHKHRFLEMLKYDPDHFGVHGFTREPSLVKRARTINVGDLDERFPGKTSVDLTKEGYDKLLGAGHVTGSYTITVNAASPKAVEKVSAKGGDVKLPKD
jgi:large subunit ribosomal protein L15